MSFKPNDLYIPPYSHIELFVLQDWDGSDGRHNRDNGLITDNKEFVDWFVETNQGASYKIVKGVMITRKEEMDNVQNELKKQKALSKLTEEERELLGFGKKKPCVMVAR